MPRLDKNELKSIIKECLIEILAEGLAPSTGTSRTSARTRKKMNEAFSGRSKRSAEAASLNRRNSYLDSIKVGGGAPTQESKSRQTSKAAMKQITSDPLMQDILSDTASTTLVAQGTASAKHASQTPRAAADRAAQIVQDNDPTELFSESAKNWATLAFS